MSDTLFTALSLLWITQLIWIIFRPKIYMIVTHAVLLLLAFTIRYQALYYPIIGSFALILSCLRLWPKIAAIALQFVLVGSFVLYTRSEMGELTGLKQFSPFGGWKMANNALYMYGHVCWGDNGPVPAKFGEMDTIVRRYFASTEVANLFDYQSDGSFYMSDYRSPLYQYNWKLYGEDTVYQNFKKWGRMGPLCEEYGSYLVRKYPLSFARYYIWPNVVRYTLPPKEIFSRFTPYILREDTLGQMASKWFGIKTLEARLRYINMRTIILLPYPTLITLTHLTFILSLIGFFFFVDFKKVNRVILHSVIVVTVLCVCNLCFFVNATGIVLRYLQFILIIEAAFALLFIDFILHSSNRDFSAIPSRNQ
jgi:hypothetical protein